MMMSSPGWKPEVILSISVKPGRNAGDVARRVAQHVEPVDGLRQNLLQRDEAGAAALAAVGDLEHALLGEIDDLVDREPFARVRARGDVAADLDEPPEHRTLANDARVGADVRGARRVLDEASEIREPAGRFELTVALELLAYRDRIGRLIALDEIRDRAEDQPVVGAVEVFDAQNVCDLVPRALVEHEPAQQRLLGLDRMRRETQLIGGHGSRSEAAGSTLGSWAA